MSKGNLKDQGGKGTNFPFQLAVLQLLGDILTASGGGGSGTPQILTSLNTGASGSVTAGATSVSFTTDGSFTGTINGAVRLPNTFYTFEAALGRTLPAIAYTVTAGTITIDKLV